MNKQIGVMIRRGKNQPQKIKKEIKTLHKRYLKTMISEHIIH